MSVSLLGTEGEAMNEEKPVPSSCHCRKGRRTRKLMVKPISNGKQIPKEWPKQSTVACYLHRLPQKALSHRSPSRIGVWGLWSSAWALPEVFPPCPSIGSYSSFLACPEQKGLLYCRPLKITKQGWVKSWHCSFHSKLAGSFLAIREHFSMPDYFICFWGTFSWGCFYHLLALMNWSTSNTHISIPKGQLA